MEITRENALKMLEARFSEYPELSAIAHSDTLLKELSGILDFHSIGAEWLDVIANEVRVVLALYAPVDELAKNIAESVGLSESKVQGLTQMIEAVILDSVYDDLLAYSFLWAEQEGRDLNLPTPESNLKEKLELRPEGVEQMAQPLTREELLSALSAKRTMASDMARVQGGTAETAPTVGYQNYKPPTASTPGQ